MRLKNFIKMNVNKQVVDPVNAVVKIQVIKADYQEKVENTIKTYRKKASIPGFRPGNAPASLIKKMYGKSMVADEVQNIVSEALYKYIRENKLSILGEPLPSEDQPEVDFEKQEDFEFCFDIALAPEMKFTLNKKDVVPYYSIQVSEEMINQKVDALTSRHGSYAEVDASEEKDMLKGLLIEIQPDGTVGAEGLSVEEAVLLPSYFRNEEEKNKMIGLRVGDTVVFNPAKAYDNNESEMASLLRLSKETAKTVTTDFSFEICEIKRFVPAVLDQSLFDQIFGKDTVTSEDEFRAKIKESFVEQFVPEADYRFMVDARNVLLKKLGDLVFPVDFLKRWLLFKENKRKAEEIDADMPKMIEELKWHLMKEQIVAENGLKVTEEDMRNVARKAACAQFARYGMMNLPEDVLNSYADDLLKKEEDRHNILDQAMSMLVAAHLKTTLKLAEKEISFEEFNKLYA